ncbi:uncharacterized protein [Paramisgurnus dabryanus]|uniref:uncharacterized protein isoform X2 n=1 Tax=Paramisgurnus dabryanus TaxID=90735 RepID=UPI0031F3AE02
MKIVIPIIVFVAVAGFHRVISASLNSTESTESSEEIESEENTTPQNQTTDDLDFKAAHVKDEDSLRVTHMEGNDEEDGKEVIDEEDTEDGEKEAKCTAKKRGNTRSESVETGTVGDYSKHTTEHTKQVDKSVKSAEDLYQYEEIRYDS